MTNKVFCSGMNLLPVEYANAQEKKLFLSSILAVYGMSGSKGDVVAKVRAMVGRFGNLSRQNYSKFRRKEMAAKHAEQAKIR